jgi:hypothetical protein
MAVSGKLVVGGILAATAAFGVGVYYAQVYGYYETVVLQEVELTTLATGAVEMIPTAGFEGIDAGSSPIRYRSCFQTELSMDLLEETYKIFSKAEPRNAPDWFDCFDAQKIGEDLQSGVATAFLGQANFEFGIDRIVAIYRDGRGFVWHQINDCGDKLYDGSSASDDCPERDQ